MLGSVRTPSAAVVLGTWTAWAAALEGALLIKEIARIRVKESKRERVRQQR